ncbi:MAG: hypothetical protein AMXMBFR33_32500 [Candidatus Xenobia bacterium]
MGISRVVLYKHGVGYFERIEEVEGNAEIRLSFKASEMNDVLKSLSLEDADGGTIQSVSYDTSKPVEQLLAEVALNIPSEGGAGALLATIRGADVGLTVGSKKHAGRVVGLEPIKKETEAGVVQSQRLTLLDEGGTLLNFDLAEISALTFKDESIKKDLAYFFETLIHSYKRDAKNLVVYARGSGKRRVNLRYVVETPVWKTSYRVLLSEDEKEKPFLEGYALVDNTQDEDWSDVRLSLVAGLPISFIHDLYSPRFIKRKEIEVQRESVAGPVMTEEAMFEDEAFGGSSAMFAAAMPMPDLDYPAPEATRMMMRAPAPLAKEKARREAARQRTAETVTQSVGDLFEYSLKHPVTVNRNQSALVPIVAHEFDGRRVVLYNSAQRAENPFAAVELKNTTGLTLEGGPLVVTEGETYAGEAMLDTLKPNDRRIVPYAVDLGVRVESEHGYKDEDATMIKVASGRLDLISARLITRVYSFKNKDKRAKLCWLEHPINHDASLFQTPEPEETTHSYYRFLVRLAPEQSTEFKVLERQDITQVVALRNLSRENLEFYLSKNYLTSAQEAQLRPLVDLAESYQKLSHKMSQTSQEINRIQNDQGRLRENLKSLGSSADENRLRSRYVEKLESQENEVESLTERLRRLDEQRQERESELAAAISRIEFEGLIGQKPEAPPPEAPAVEEPELPFDDEEDEENEEEQS